MQRFTMRIQLDSDARQSLVELCDRTGMTQIAVMSRVLTWFAGQNQVIQARVLGGLSEDTVAELARQLLERMALGDVAPPRPLNADPAAERARLTSRAATADRAATAPSGELSPSNVS